MIKIGLLGANGQVGAEVAFYLSLHEDVNLSCLIRSEYSAAAFKLLSIPYSVVDYDDTKKLSDRLSDFDVLLDFSSETGEISEILRWLKRHVPLIVGCMHPGGKYIYMSSIMAYGMPNPIVALKNHLFPRTFYAHSKRYAEMLARKAGNKRQVDIFNFRLGQVHGSLQTITQLFVSKLSSGTFRVNGTPQSLTNAIFTHSISEAVSQSIQGKVIPGTYTLVSYPQWTSEELFRFYENWHGFKAKIKYTGTVQVGPFYSADFFDTLKKMRSFRDIMETYFLINFPSVMFGIKGRFRKKAAQSEISSIQAEDDVYPMLLGPVPWNPAPVIPNIRSSIPEAQKSIEYFEKTLFEVIDKAKKRTGASHV